MSCSLQQVAGLERPGRVKVNGVAIARDAIAREAQNHPAEKPLTAWQAAARALVVRELLLQEARRLALTPQPLSDEAGRRETEDEALVRQVIETEVRVPDADEATCRRFYEQNLRRFRSADLHEARHILLAADVRDGKAREEARRQAQDLVAALQRDPSQFAALAESLSACPSGKTGGHLGQIGPGQTVPEFEQALAKLPPGAPAAIETRYGVHVVVLDHRIEGRELPFELVREKIAAWLAERVRRTAIHQYLSILAGRADIQGIDMQATGSPLVQ
jgi:peptidyl-prolyl cis-trans isomerase C